MFWQSSRSYNYWCFYLFIINNVQIVGGQNETEQQMSQRTAKETVSPWQTQQQSFHCFEGHSLFSVRVTQSYKASFCLENSLPYNFYLDISQEKAEAEEKLMCLKLLFCRPRRCFSKQKHQPLKPDNLSSVPRVHRGRRADSLRAALAPPTSTITTA